MRAPRNARQATSPILSLPPEVHGIITSYLVQFRDINSLTRSCKAFKAIAVPQLYRTVELKIPLKWNRLASLEKLLAASPEGLSYTRGIRIVPKQAPIGDDQYETPYGLNITDDVEEEEEEQTLMKMYRPGRAACCALNPLIHLLILKISKQQLTEFCWNHECPVASSTLAILFNNHGASLQTLYLRRYTEEWKRANLAALELDCLTSLTIGALEVDEDSRAWLPFHLLAKNYVRLRHLQLSNETAIAEQYAVSANADSSGDKRWEDTMRTMNTMRDQFVALNESTVPVLCLESLYLSGLSLDIIIGHSLEPIIDFSNLKSLTIESCDRLVDALPMLMGYPNGRRDTVGVLQLRTLILRHEHALGPFMQELERFLVSLKPLTTLHVLLEGHCSSQTQILHKSLKTHGKSLRSLVWDHRCFPRTRMSISSFGFPSDIENLKLIANYCTRLEALGIPLAWEDLTESNAGRTRISTCFSKLKQLRTLNIRNLPNAPDFTTALPNDYSVEALATLLMDVIKFKAGEDRQLLLKTLAIGAATFGNTRMGVNHYSMHRAADYLQLRIYRINHDCSTQERTPARPTLIAKGTPADARGNADNLSIFDIYWLDTFPVIQHTSLE